MVANSRPKLLNLPRCTQRNDRDCGPAVARSVLQFFGRPCVRVDAVLTPEGTPPERLAGLFLRSRLGVAFRERLDLDQLRGLVEGLGPVLCPVAEGGDGHWVAVRGVGRKAVHLLDPAPDRGPVAVASDDFLARWRDRTADGVELVRFGLCVFDVPGADRPHQT